jgi:hypothetical protein
MGVSEGYAEGTGQSRLGSRCSGPTPDAFMSVDSTMSQTHQAHIYAGDDPVNQTDPSGQMQICADSQMTPGTVGQFGFAPQGCQINQSTVNSVMSLRFNGQTISDAEIASAQEFVQVKTNAAVCPNGVCWVFVPLLLFMAVPSRFPDLSAVEWIIYSNLYRDKIDPYDNTGTGYYTEAEWLQDWGSVHNGITPGDQSLEAYNNIGDWSVADDASLVFEAVHDLEPLGLASVIIGSGNAGGCLT